MTTKKYPHFLGVNLDDKTWRQLNAVADIDERNRAQQARYWIKRGLEEWKLFRVCEWMAGRLH